MKNQHHLNLYSVRHGESEGNVDNEIYKTKADHALRLKPRGIEQAIAAGNFLAEFLHEEYEKNPEEFGSIRVWYSSYYRGQETAGHILTQLAKKFDPDSDILTYREEPFLIEQKAGLFDSMDDEKFRKAFPAYAADYDKHVAFNGRVYAKTPLGDSRLEVIMRVKPLFGTILRDYNVRNIRHVISVSHGVTVRAMTVGWMRYPLLCMDTERNPGNCWIRHIHGNSHTGYKDEGYIHGENAPIRDPLATQKAPPNADEIFMLRPQRPNAIIPPGIKVLNPFARSSAP